MTSATLAALAIAAAAGCGGVRLTGGDGGAIRAGDGAADVLQHSDAHFVEKECPKGGCTLVTLASGLAEPINIAVDGASVYWTDSTANAVISMPLDGGILTTLATGQPNPFQLAVQGGNLYWIAGPLRTMPVTGGTPRVIATGPGSPVQFALDATQMCWTVLLGPGFGGMPSLLVAPLGGGTTVTVAGGQSCIAIDTGYVYWAGGVSDAGGFDTIVREGLAGGDPMTLFSGDNVPTYMTLVDGVIYGTGSAITSRSAAGGAVTTLAADASDSPLAVDANSVFWFAGGNVLGVPRTGGPVVTLATGREKMEYVAVDATSVYWTERAPGRVMKVVKP